MVTLVHLLLILDVHYHSHHTPDSGDEEERPQHIICCRVTMGLGGTGHCGATLDVGSQRAGWSAHAVGPWEAPPLGPLPLLRPPRNTLGWVPGLRSFFFPFIKLPMLFSPQNILDICCLLSQWKISFRERRKAKQKTNIWRNKSRHFPKFDKDDKLTDSRSSVNAKQKKHEENCTEEHRSQIVQNQW